MFACMYMGVHSYSDEHIASTVKSSFPTPHLIPQHTHTKSHLKTHIHNLFDTGNSQGNSNPAPAYQGYNDGESREDLGMYLNLHKHTHAHVHMHTHVYAVLITHKPVITLDIRYKFSFEHPICNLCRVGRY